MQQIRGDIWEFHKQGSPITITTNGDLNKHGLCVMGRGIALQAKQRFPHLPYVVAQHINANGNVVGFFPKYNLFTFPTKDHWWENSSFQLIEDSAIALNAIVTKRKMTRLYMTQPGTGNGKLHWNDVEPLISLHLDDRFIVVENR
jgi:hypothetical protein